MEQIIKILMKRDGMDYDDAKSLVEGVREEVQDAINAGDYNLAEEIMMDDLMLEMDYIFALI